MLKWIPILKSTNSPNNGAKNLIENIQILKFVTVSKQFITGVLSTKSWFSSTRNGSSVAIDAKWKRNENKLNQANEHKRRGLACYLSN